MRTCIATGTPSIVPCHSGRPGIHGEDNLWIAPSSKVTAMASPSRSTSTRISSLPSDTARRRGVQLARNPPLALAEHMVDRHSDRGHGPRHGAGRRRVLETAGEFFGDEAGRELAVAPARMRHDG